MLSFILSWQVVLILLVPVVIARFAWQRKWRWTAIGLAVLSALLLVAMVLPSSQMARDNNQRSNCIANLRQLEDAKAQWATKTKVQPAAVPQPADLLPFLISGNQPTCPANGTYTLGAVNEPPRCSHADKGHKLASSP